MLYSYGQWVLHGGPLPICKADFDSRLDKTATPDESKLAPALCETGKPQLDLLIGD